MFGNVLIYDGLKLIDKQILDKYCPNWFNMIKSVVEAEQVK
jgi:hypothetical protein